MTDHDDKLWKRVDDWRDKLRNYEHDSILGQLERAWLAGREALPEQDWYRRDERWKENPIDLVMSHIRFGAYPPPELMLAMLECYEAYTWERRGSLEEMFFGKPVQRAGDYASRRKKQSADLTIVLRFIEYLTQGMSRINAAEHTVNELELSIDAESVLRKVRDFKGFEKWRKTDN